MAACPPINGDGVDSKNFVSTPSLQTPKLIGNNSHTISSSSEGNSKVISLDGEQAYDTVANFEESELRNLLEEVISQNQSKTDKSPIAQYLIRREEDALREESGSGEDTIDLALGRQRKKKSNNRRDHCTGTHLGSSAAARNNTGGSLGSLHNLSDPKVPEQTNPSTQGVASRSRAGGSCGNLSKGSFETHACKRKRRSKEINRASTSIREGGSLQNLSKTEAASNESKKLHKSGSLSQVFSEVGGVRLKNRRQKTSSESSGRIHCRRSEDREAGGQSSEEDIGEYPYQRFIPSSHSSVSGHSGDQGESSVVGMVGGRWNGDPMSDVASGETTEEDGESMHISARTKLGDTSRHHLSEGSDTELHSVVSHTSHRDVLPTISSDSEVDKPINFCLGGKSHEDTVATTTTTTVLSYAAPCVNSVLENKTSPKDDDSTEKKKQRNNNNKVDGDHLEKSSLDENGNPVLMSVRSNITGGSSSTGPSSLSSVQVACSDRHSTSLPIGRRNGFSSQTKDQLSTYSRLKAKQDKKKVIKKGLDVIEPEGLVATVKNNYSKAIHSAIKEKDVMPSEKTPGFRGDDSLDNILKYLGAYNTSGSKSRKNKKGKKDDEKDGMKNKKMKSLDKSSNEDMECDKIKFDECSSDFSNGKGKNDDSGSDTKERKWEEDCKNKKKGKYNKRGKKSSGLRESSSVEDLVSKSKQIDNVKEVRKQVTVDDGGLSPFHCCGNLKNNYTYEPYLVNPKSEFSCDFYKVGDALCETEPTSAENEEFEVVNRKKGRKARNSSTVSQGAKAGGSGGWTNSSNNIHLEDQRRSTFPRSNPPRNSSKVSSQDKPQINFGEGPYTVHDGVFISQFSGGSRSVAGECYTTTTSALHSEDSDSDGGTSVHSMPPDVITPRPQVRKPPPSTDSTPQASYANIAKLAATSNKTQMKKVVASHSVSAPQKGPEEDANRNQPDAAHQDPKLELTNHLLDDNFPPLSGAALVSSVITAGAITNNNNITKISDYNITNSDTNNELLMKDLAPPVVKKDCKTFAASPNSDSSLSENSFKINFSGDNSANLSDIISTSKVQAYITPVPNAVLNQCTKNPPIPVMSHSLPITCITTTTTTLNVVAKPSVPHSQTIVYSAACSNHVPTPKLCTHNSKTISGLTKVSQNNNNNINYNNNLISHSSGVSCNNLSKGVVSEKSNNKSLVCKENKNNSNKHYKNKDSSGVENNGPRNRKYEPAVIFTDNANFDLSTLTGIEFGFDMSMESISNLSDKVTDASKSNGFNDTNLEAISSHSSDNNKNIKNLQTSSKDYSKLYQAPSNDVISYNYEELCRHVYKGWESTLRMLEEDPKNIEYWKASERVEKN